MRVPYGFMSRPAVSSHSETARLPTGHCDARTHTGNIFVRWITYAHRTDIQPRYVNQTDMPRSGGEASEVMSTDPTLQPTNIRVLVVDDDVALRRMIAMVLEDAGWDLLEAKDGLEALAIMRSSQSGLVVLLDWKMPEMSGEEVLEVVVASPELVMRHAYVLVTANTAAMTPHLADLLHRLEAPVVSKPFSIRDLLSTVEVQARRIAAAEATC